MLGNVFQYTELMLLVFLHMSAQHTMASALACKLFASECHKRRCVFQVGKRYLLWDISGREWRDEAGVPLYLVADDDGNMMHFYEVSYTMANVFTVNNEHKFEIPVPQELLFDGDHYIHVAYTTKDFMICSAFVYPLQSRLVHVLQNERIIRPPPVRWLHLDALVQSLAAFSNVLWPEHKKWTISKDCARLMTYLHEQLYEPNYSGLGKGPHYYLERLKEILVAIQKTRLLRSTSSVHLQANRVDLRCLHFFIRYFESLCGKLNHMCNVYGTVSGKPNPQNKTYSVHDHIIRNRGRQPPVD